MELFIWILQALIAFVFLYSGINKSYFDEKTLVQRGQTGVEGLPHWLIKAIGISEIFGAIGLILPMMVGRLEILTPLAAICLGAIMIPAAVIHYRRNEPKTIMINLTILIICGIVACWRIPIIG